MSFLTVKGIPVISVQITDGCMKMTTLTLMIRTVHVRDPIICYTVLFVAICIVWTLAIIYPDWISLIILIKTEKCMLIFTVPQPDQKKCLQIETRTRLAFVSVQIKNVHSAMG